MTQPERQAQTPHIAPADIPWFKQPLEKYPATTSSGRGAMLYDRAALKTKFMQLLAPDSERTISISTSAQLSPEAQATILAALEGKSAQADFTAIARAGAYLFDEITRGATNAQEIKETLYENRETFFPAALQLLSTISGERVSAPHAKRNPLEHTCDALAQYVVAQAAKDAAEQPATDDIVLEIATLILHDYGKLPDPLDATHPSGSVEWGRQWITGIAENMGTLTTYTPEETAYILRFLTRFHDVFGNIDSGSLSITEALNQMIEEGYLPTTRLLLSLRRIQAADMAAIPKMRSDFIANNNRIALEMIELLERTKAEYNIPDRLIAATQLSR